MMKRFLRYSILASVMLLSANPASAHGRPVDEAAQRFEEAARVMQHRLYHNYGRSHLTRGARHLARQARHYRRALTSGQPPRQVHRDFRRLTRAYAHFREDWRYRPAHVDHGGLRHAAVRLKRAYWRLRQAQRSRYAGRRSHAWEIGS